MSDADVIVIGGGHNGLVAATACARAGKSVLLLEASDRLGGMAAPGAFGLNGAPRMAHLVYNLSPAMRKALGLDASHWPFELRELDSVSLCPAGRHVIVSGREVRLANGTAHPDAEAWRGLTRRLQTYGDLLRQLAEAPPPGAGAPLASREGLALVARLARFGLGVKRLGKAEMREFLRVLLSNAADLILDEMPDGPLAGLLAADGLRGASAGPRAPGTVFSMIYRMGHGGRASQPIGGMGRVIDMLAGAARTAGCRIETGARAARVLLEGDRVIGVETEAGTQFTASLVLSNLPPLATATLAGLEHFDIEATKRMHKLRTRGAVAKINLRLSALPRITSLPEDIHSRARFIHAPGVDFVETAFNPSKYGEMSADPVIEAVFPSATDPALAQEGGHLMSLIVQYAPYALKGGWDDAARQRLLSLTLDTLADYAPGLPDLVTESEILAPPDIEALTGIEGGHWHHCEMSLDQLFSLRPGNGMGHYRMGPAGLYLCGASTHPGGDLMGLSGLNAARLALAEEARS